MEKLEIVYLTLFPVFLKINENALWQQFASTFENSQFRNKLKGKQWRMVRSEHDPGILDPCFKYISIMEIFQFHKLNFLIWQAFIF